MHYDTELQLLTDLFRRAGSSVTVIDPDRPASQYLNPQLDLPEVAKSEDISAPLRDYLPGMLPETVYTITDRLFLKYIYLLLPETSPASLLAISYRQSPHKFRR